MSTVNLQVNGNNPWASGKVNNVNDVKIIDVQLIRPDGTTANSAGGYIGATDYPATSSGVMTVNGTLIVNMNYPVSTVYFGMYTEATGNTGNTAIPNITQTGRVFITGCGSYNGNNFINFVNLTQNNGEINVSNISMKSGASTSEIRGTGTLNLENVRLIGNNQNYGQGMIGMISGGQTVNMTASDLTVYRGYDNVTINMHGGGNYLAFLPNNTANDVRIRGFGQGDLIDFSYGGNTDYPFYDPGTGILRISSGNMSLTLDIGLGYDPMLFSSAKSASGVTNGVIYSGPAPCYLTGTLIETPTGYVAVEQIQQGMEVYVYDGANRRISPVTWAGQGTAAINKGYNGLDADFPVRISKGAFGNNEPFADLLVTQEHCFAFDNCLVPIRMLVNGRTICLETSIRQYDYHHFTLAEHGVVRANGALSESLHVSAGELKRFDHACGDIVPHGDTALPVNTDRDFVEPLYRKLLGSDAVEDRSAEGPEAVTLALHLDDGRVVPVSRQVDGRVQFDLPSGAGVSHLRTEALRPSEIVGPFVDDRRQLGLLVREVVLHEDGKPRRLSICDADLAGWHARESDGADTRWTSGVAGLPLRVSPGIGKAVLELEIVQDCLSVLANRNAAGTKAAA